jgi:hypothetical protein
MGIGLEIFSIVLGVFTTLLIPLIVLIVRGSIRWTKIETKLDNLSEDIKDLKDQMTDDRAATNNRLTWLERRRGHAVRD